jgi:putative aldouronate transport system permease protein
MAHDSASALQPIPPDHHSLKQASTGSVLVKSWTKHPFLYVLLIPAIVLLLLFRIYPFWGISIAFVDYNPIKGISGSEWVGFKHFIEVFRRPEIANAIRNTFIISLGKIMLGETFGLIFALMLFELRAKTFKRVVQTMSTIPHFFSWVIVGALVVNLLGSSGSINDMLAGMGLAKIKFLSDKTVFPLTLIFTDVWKEFGWSAVIYLAGLTQINPELLEAAAVDGAGRWPRMLHIILPGIVPLFVFMIAMGIGYILDAGFEQVLVLYNPAVYSSGDILDTYIYRVGLVNFKFEIATVVGIIKAVVGFVAITCANWVSGKLTGRYLY